MRKKRGQAAVEFITTYGWALLAILVTIGLFSYFDFFNPDRFTNQYCNTGSQIDCIEVYLETNGTFRISFRNEYNVDIEILGINATIDDRTVRINLQDTSNVILRGQSRVVGNERLETGVLFQGNKKEVRLAVDFRRVGGSETYTIRGSSVVEVSETLCGNNVRNIGEQCDIVSGTFQGIFDTCAQLPEYNSSNTEALGCTLSCTYSTVNC